MPKNACILLNGYYDLTRSAWYQQQIQQPDTLLVAVDGGLHACTPLGLRPVLIIGDFDSISESELTQFMGSEIVRLSKNKDFTDGEVAVRECINRSVSDITLFGALAVAGETDQELGNIFMMHMAKKMAAQKGITPFQIKLMDPRQ
ncbi:MAG TPA: thiamine diphosphokinase, partial [bacterium]|nr:thiamine diphosphokinase [bacterium]